MALARPLLTIDLGQGAVEGTFQAVLVSDPSPQVTNGDFGCFLREVQECLLPARRALRTLPHIGWGGDEFGPYVDAIGHLDRTRRLLEWKTTSARYPDQPEGLTSLDL